MLVHPAPVLPCCDRIQLTEFRIDMIPTLIASARHAVEEASVVGFSACVDVRREAIGVCFGEKVRDPETDAAVYLHRRGLDSLVGSCHESPHLSKSVGVSADTYIVSHGGGKVKLTFSTFVQRVAISALSYDDRIVTYNWMAADTLLPFYVLCNALGVRINERR